MPTTLADIAGLTGAKLVGADAVVTGVASLEEATPSQLSLCLNRRHADALQTTRAGGVIMPARAKSLALMAPCAVLLAEEPRLALAKVLELFYPQAAVEPGVEPGAHIATDADVAPTARIEPGVCVEAGVNIGARTLLGACAFVGAGARIGADCRLGPHATVLGGCTLGDRVTLGAGAVVGSPGFGFVPDDKGQLRRIPQVGTVIVGDDVEIGAGTTVDRGTLGATRIGAGTKIDNLVQVAHNVTIGRHVIIAAQCGLSGSVTIGDGAVLGGQAGVSDHIAIGAGAQVGAKSGVGSHVPPGERVAGYPAMPVRSWLENAFLFRRMKRLLGRTRDGSEA